MLVEVVKSTANLIYLQYDGISENAHDDFAKKCIEAATRLHDALLESRDPNIRTKDICGLLALHILIMSRSVSKQEGEKSKRDLNDFIMFFATLQDIVIKLQCLFIGRGRIRIDPRFIDILNMIVKEQIRVLRKELNIVVVNRPPKRPSSEESTKAHNLERYLQTFLACPTNENAMLLYMGMNYGINTYNISCLAYNAHSVRMNSIVNTPSISNLQHNSQLLLELRKWSSQQDLNKFFSSCLVWMAGDIDKLDGKKWLADRIRNNAANPTKLWSLETWRKELDIDVRPLMPVYYRPVYQPSWYSYPLRHRYYPARY